MCVTELSQNNMETLAAIVREDGILKALLVRRNGSVDFASRAEKIRPSVPAETLGLWSSEDESGGTAALAGAQDQAGQANARQRQNP